MMMMMMMMMMVMMMQGSFCGVFSPVYVMYCTLAAACVLRQLQVFGSEFAASIGGPRSQLLQVVALHSVLPWRRRLV